MSLMKSIDPEGVRHRVTHKLKRRVYSSKVILFIKVHIIY